MNSHKESIYLLLIASPLICALCEQIGFDPDRISIDFSHNGGNLGSVNVGEIVRRIDKLIERDEWMLDGEVL